VILEEHLARVGAATAAERPDVAIVVVGEGSREALARIGTIVHEATCPVIAILDVEDPLFIREATKRGIFAYITTMEDPRELESSIDIVLRRFAEYHDLEGAFSRRAVTERAKGVLMERHAIDEREAFDMLRTEARHSNRKLIEIAEAVLTSHRLLPRSGDAEDPADVRDHPRTS
jgi:response regulator NasT